MIVFNEFDVVMFVEWETRSYKRCPARGLWLSSKADSNEETKKHMATCLQEEDTRGGDTESLVDLEEILIMRNVSEHSDDVNYLLRGGDITR